MQKSDMIRRGVAPSAKKDEPDPPPAAPVRTSMDVRETFPAPRRISDRAVRKAGSVYLNGARAASLGFGGGRAICHIEPDGDDEDLSDCLANEACRTRRHATYVLTIPEKYSRLGSARERERERDTFLAKWCRR
jgi:hypothetical protein